MSVPSHSPSAASGSLRPNISTGSEPMWSDSSRPSAGGMLRDVLLNEVPLIFRKDIYAIACICGGLIYYLCMYLDLPAAPTQFIAACSVILIRILAVRYGISLPALKGETRPAPKEK